MALRSFSPDTARGGARRDLRNFEVRSRSTNQHVGTVHDLIVDDGGGTRYLCVAEPGNARHVLVPVGDTDADGTSRIVWVADDAALRSLPSYPHEPSAIDEAYERSLAAGVEKSYGDRHWYERPEYRGTNWRTGNGHRGSGRLERLDGASDFQVARDDPDPRGWEVVGRDGRTLGEVDHLIGDTGSMRVLYLGVRVDRAIDENRRIVLIPVGLVDLDSEHHQVIARGFDAGCMQQLPPLRGGTVTRDEERTILMACTEIYSGARRYEHPRFRERQLPAVPSLRDRERATDNEARPDVR